MKCNGWRKSTTVLIHTHTQTQTHTRPHLILSRKFREREADQATCSPSDVTLSLAPCGKGEVEREATHIHESQVIKPLARKRGAVAWKVSRFHGKSSSNSQYRYHPCEARDCTHDHLPLITDCCHAGALCLFAHTRRSEPLLLRWCSICRYPHFYCLSFVGMGGCSERARYHDSCCAFALVNEIWAAIQSSHSEPFLGKHICDTEVERECVEAVSG